MSYTMELRSIEEGIIRNEVKLVLKIIGGQPQLNHRLAVFTIWSAVINRLQCLPLPSDRNNKLDF